MNLFSGKVRPAADIWSVSRECIHYLVFFFLVFCVPVHALEVPKLQGYVNDYAGMISPQAKATLEQELQAFEQSDSTQIVVLTIPSLEGEVLEEFSIKVAEQWKIGQKGKDNGIIVLVSKQDRKIRIEVGRGLEGKITDLMSGRIIDLVIKPKFKRGDFDSGLISGIHALIDATRGEFKADSNRETQRRNGPSRLLTFLIFGGYRHPRPREHVALCRSYRRSSGTSPQYFAGVHIHRYVGLHNTCCCWRCPWTHSSCAIFCRGPGRRLARGILRG